jgi:uncharacterized protein
MAIFRLILFIVTAAMTTYVAHQLTRFADFPKFIEFGVVILVVSSALFSALMPAFYWSDRGRLFVQKHNWALPTSFYSLALFGGLLSIVVARDLLAYSIEFFTEKSIEPLYGSGASVGIIAVTIVINFIAWLNVKSGPRLIRTSLIDERLPLDFDHLKIAQISDLHISNFVPQAFVQKVVDMVVREQPHLIFLTGDIIDGDPTELSKSINFLKSLTSSIGVFFVPGNHEYYWGIEQILKSLENSSIKILINDVHHHTKNNSRLLIGGIPDVTAKMFQKEAANFSVFQQHYSQDQYRILLAHQPNTAPTAALHDFHLQLSGHTHGGQFFPWNFLIRLAQRYPRGFFKIKDMHLYVNQGTAYWGPALRFGTHCEITIKTLRRPS